MAEAGEASPGLEEARSDALGHMRHRRSAQPRPRLHQLALEGRRDEASTLGPSQSAIDAGWSLR